MAITKMEKVNLKKQDEKRKLKKTAPRKTNIMLVIACGVVILVVIGSLIRLSHSNDRIIESRDWPQTTGVVISTHVKTGRADLGGDSGWGGDSGNTVTYYVPALEYAYSVGYRKYTSQNISADSSWGLESFDTQNEAEIYLTQNYPVGTEVVVYYNPENPQDAFLFQQEPISTVEISIMLYALIVFLLGIMVYVLLNLDKPFVKE